MSHLPMQLPHSAVVVILVAMIVLIVMVVLLVIFGVVVLLVFNDYIDMVMLASDEEFDFLLQSFGGNCAFWWS